MMKAVARIDGGNASPRDGRPVVDWRKLAWNGTMLAGSLAAPFVASWSAAAMFVVLTYVTLLVGHSVGMHRLLIHRALTARKPVEYGLVYIGVLVGVAGPHGIVRIHDIRDWAQRQPACHDFFAHRRSFVRDLSWQLGYRFAFDRPPAIRLEPALGEDRFYRCLEATWRWHQLAVAIPLHLLGGWPWVVWGVCLRVFVSTAGHWAVTFFAHRPGDAPIRVVGASVQAANLPALGLLTYGECWHNNHHAFPESARIGLDPGQADPGWWLIRALAAIGAVTSTGRPRDEADREDLAPAGRRKALPSA